MFVERQIGVENYTASLNKIQPIKRIQKAIEKPCKRCSSSYRMNCFTTCVKWDRYSMMKKL